MQNLKNDRLMRALSHQKLDYTPIWIMRQAGRYLPEYREVRSKAGSFLNLCKTPHLAAEVTLQPIRRYPLDAAIIFSDILTIPDAMGLGLHFQEGKGPFFSKPLHSCAAIDDLPELDITALNYVYETIQLVEHTLAKEVPLIGFCGSPWTLAMYMIQGYAMPSFPQAMEFYQQNPRAFERLLNKLERAIAAHLIAQIKAGVHIVMIFDTWGGLLSPTDYQTFSLAPMQRIIDHLRADPEINKVPLILFSKGAHHSLAALANTGAHALGVDSMISLQAVRKVVGRKVALQGNLEPSILLKKAHEIEEEVAKVLASFGQGSGHIFNLGHGITPDVPPLHVAKLVEAVHELSKAYHA